MLFPIVIGSVVNTLLAFPVPAVLSVIYPATSSYVIMSGFGAIMKSASEGGVRSEIEERVMKSMVVLTVCVICLNRLLTLGLG